MKNHFYDSENGSSSNKSSLSRLKRTIELSQGQFTLVLACCNCSALRRQMIAQLHEASSIPIQELTLHPSIDTLFTTLETALQQQQPPALMVLGLESVVAIDQVLNATNLARDEFSKHFSFPLVLWTNDELLQKLRRLAPDFRNWADPSPIRFEFPNHNFYKRQTQIMTG